MSKPLFSVFKFEFVRQIKKPSFWASILLMPLLMVAVFVISLTASSSTSTSAELDEDTKIAITDEAGILKGESPFVIQGSKEQGIELVKNGDVKLYFYIPSDFKDTKKLELYHISEGLDLFNSDGNAIKVILNQSVASRFDELEVIALTGGFEIDDNKLTITGEPANPIGKMVVPMTFLVVFFLFIVLFGSRLLLIVVEEKENRISEMILTSVSARHLIIGKIFAMMALGLIQIATFIIPVVIALIIYHDNPIVSTILSATEITPANVAANALVFVLSCLLTIGVCTYIGAITPNAKDASQFIGPIIVTLVVPLYFMQSFLAAEPDALVQFFTYFPTSAPIAIMLRSAFGTLTTPEFIIGCVEIATVACLVIWVTIKTFERHAISSEIILPKFLRKR